MLVTGAGGGLSGWLWPRLGEQPLLHQDKVELLVLVESDTASENSLWSTLLAAAGDAAALRLHRDVSHRLSRPYPSARIHRVISRGSVALPLDEATWAALQRCQDHRRRLGSDNPHLLVTRLTRTHRGPAGAAHVRDSLAPVGLLPRILRSTRLLALADELDAKILTVSLGMSYAGVAHYRPSPALPKPM